MAWQYGGRGLRALLQSADVKRRSVRTIDAVARGRPRSFSPMVSPATSFSRLAYGALQFLRAVRGRFVSAQFLPRSQPAEAHRAWREWPEYSDALPSGTELDCGFV